MKRILSLLLLSSLSIFSHAVSVKNNYDPHYPSGGRGLWFEGWYTRIVDPQNGRSFASVGGSFCAPGRNCKNMQGLPGYLALIHQGDINSKFAVEETFPNSTKITAAGSPVHSNPDYASLPNFKWESESNGFFTNDSIHLQFQNGKMRFDANLTDPTYWNPANPGEGPEGIVGMLPLQQHWFVYSTKSQVQYTFQSGDSVVSGTGYAHQEKNWGSSFPTEWVWTQAISGDGKYQFAISGGKVPVVGSLGIHAWLVGWRSPKFNWSFHPQDLTSTFEPEVHSCNGTYTMDVKSLTNRLVVTISAPMSTFTSLAVPVEKGFVANGCVESYAARATVKVYNWGNLVETVQFKGAALEFGGNYLCKKH